MLSNSLLSLISAGEDLLDTVVADTTADTVVDDTGDAWVLLPRLVGVSKSHSGASAAAASVSADGTGANESS